MVEHRFDAIQSDAYAHHVELLVGEADNACGVEDMADNVVAEFGLNHCRTFFKICELLHGVGILRWLIGHAQVREHRRWLDYALALEQFDKRWYLLLGETEAVHTGVEFDVHRKFVRTVFRTLFDEFAAFFYAVNFWFKVVCKHCLVVHHRWVEHDNWHGDTCLAQVHALILHCHSQIVATGILQCFGYFVTACAVAACLHHAHSLGFGFEERAEEFEVVRQGIEVNLFHGLMLLGFEQVENLLKLKFGCAFHQYGLVFEVACRFLVEKFCHTCVELCVDAGEVASVAAHVGANAYQVLDMLALEQLAHTDIKFVGTECLWHQVAQNHSVGLGWVAATNHEVERGGERIVVAGVAVGYHGAVVHALYHIDASAHRGEGGHALCYHILLHAQHYHHHKASDHILQIAVGGKRNGDGVRLASVFVGDAAFFGVFFHISHQHGT